MKNIILDFMDPENRILYGTYKNYSADEHVSVLKKALNLAVLICKDYCILPPCAILQCRHVREALFQSEDYLDEELIRFPLRESSLSDFFEKKKKNYELDKDDEDYSDFFSGNGPEFLQLHLTGLIKRETKMGEAIAMSIAALPFEDPLWAELKEEFNIPFLETLRQAPSILISQGAAISVKGIKRLLSINDDIDFQIGRILQNKYFSIYISEYDAEIIYGIPPKTTDFLLKNTCLLYDYRFLRHVFKSLGLFNVIQNASPAVIIKIRETAAYYDFMQAIESVANHASDLQDAKRIVSSVVEKMENNESVYYDQCESKQLIEVISKQLRRFVSSYKHSFSARPAPIRTRSESVEKKQRIDELKLRLKPCDMNKPFVFIGYNREDFEETVYKDCILLGDLGVNYWIDNANMEGCEPDSDGWMSIIRKAISACSVYIPYISPGFLNSAPCCSEVKTYFESNHSSSIIILVQNGYPVDHIIQKILTYDNILQGDIARSMVMLFKAAGAGDEKYTIDQPYRYVEKSLFAHYINDSIIFNTFLSRRVLRQDRLSFKEWRACALDKIKEMERQNTEE